MPHVENSPHRHLPPLLVKLPLPDTREEYETAGVPEYWLVDPDRQYAEFYQRDEAGLYRVAFGGSEGVYRSRVLEGFWLQAEWLWTRPPLREVLTRLGLA